MNFKGLEVPNDVCKNAFLALLKRGEKCLAAPTCLGNDGFMFLSVNLNIPFWRCGMNQGNSEEQ